MIDTNETNLQNVHAKVGRLPSQERITTATST